MNKKQLEERLINFSVMIIKIADKIPSSKAGNHLSGQMVRSATSSALNYGEAQSGESRKDFIHKMKIVLKELRETLVCLRIIQKAELIDSDISLSPVIAENDELISIFVKSVNTAQKNLSR